MADMTAILSVERRTPKFDMSAIDWKVLTLDFGLAANASMLATGTHNIMTWPAGAGLAFGKAFVVTSMASTSNDGTIKFLLNGGDDLSPAMTADGTELVAGDSFPLGIVDYEDAAGKKCYSATATTLDMTIATHAMTAGKIVLVLGIVNLTDLSSNG